MAARQPAPKPNPGGLAKPADLSPDASWIWDQVTAQAAAGELLKPIDGPALEVLCETFARWREAVAFRKAHALLTKNSQGTIAAPWIGIEERAAGAFKNWAAEYGLTPLARGAFDDVEPGQQVVKTSTMDELKAKREARRRGAA